MTAREYTTDTSAEASRLPLELIRQQSPVQRLKATFQMSARVCRQCKAAIRRSNPGFSKDDVRLKFIEITYGTELAEPIRLWRNWRFKVEDANRVAKILGSDADIEYMEPTTEGLGVDDLLKRPLNVNQN